MKKIIIIEDIVIILSVFSLWPMILRLPGKGYKYFMYFCLLLLFIILINRIKRIIALGKGNKKYTDRVL